MRAALQDPATGKRVAREVVRRLLAAWRYTSELVPTSSGHVHVWAAEGSGPGAPVLVIHGLGSQAMYWVPMLEHLRPHVARVMAVDLPGHGFSDRLPALSHETLQSALFEGLRRFDHQPAAIIGHSLGGAAALRYVNAAPDRARGLLLFSPAGAPLDAEQLATVRRLFRVDSYEDAVRFLRLLHARPAELRARVAAPFVRASLRDPALRAWLDSVPAYDPTDPDPTFLNADEIRSVRVPLRVVWGRVDRVLPTASRDFWRQNLPPGASWIEPPHVGHTPFLDDRRWTASELRSFVASLDR